MGIPNFIGREKELVRLRKLLQVRSASLVVIRGRRRIGKSRLLAEFGKEMPSYFFSGLPPAQKKSAQAQRDEFAYQLENAGFPAPKADDWNNLFWHLSNQTQKGRVLIVLDEISWMGGKDPHFLGKLKNAWDMYFSKNPQLILVLCGSISSWIEENILSSTGFVGRIAIDMVLQELPLEACNAFWNHGNRITAYEKFKFLSISGGVPLYLERMRPEIPAEQNIKELCFTQGGLLVREFEEIFSDLFSRKNVSYREIVQTLAEGPKDLEQICKKLEKEVGGVYSKYLDDLIKAGFLQRDFTWNLRDGKEGKLSRYRLSDNYLRFYLKYIAPQRSKIERGTFTEKGLTLLPGWEKIMGLQFENLVSQNRKILYQLLDIACEDVVMDGPFFQKTTVRQPGCQIDFLIQTRFNSLYLCEIKFSQNPIKHNIIAEVEEKIRRLKRPKGYSIRPILLHVNGVDSSVDDERYFDRIVDFGQFLAPTGVVEEKSKVSSSSSSRSR